MYSTQIGVANIDPKPMIKLMFICIDNILQGNQVPFRGFRGRRVVILSLIRTKIKFVRN
jgi:hypothetical protein